MKTEAGWSEAVPKKAGSRQKLGAAKDSPIEPPEGAWPHLDFRVLASRMVQRIHVCCFKSLSLWSFGLVVSGNEHTFG